MKKLIPLIGLVLIGIYSCCTNRLSPNSCNRITPDTHGIALNGDSEKMIKEQINYFVNHKDEDNRPEIASVWFNKKTIMRIYDLVKSECGDGIRVYYVADPSGVPYMKASIVLVSTKKDKPVCHDQSWHRDYYIHKSDSLFTDPIKYNIKGELRNDNCDEGALLYTMTGLNDKCIPVDTHFVSRKNAEKMVNRNNRHKHVINTISEWFELSMFGGFRDTDKYDGVRFYFARRRGFLGLFTTGRNSFLITATQEKKNSKGETMHQDDLTCNQDNPLYKWLDDFKTKKYGILDADAVSNALDNGQLCPKNCN